MKNLNIKQLRKLEDYLVNFRTGVDDLIHDDEAQKQNNKKYSHKDYFNQPINNLELIEDVNKYKKRSGDRMFTHEKLTEANNALTKMKDMMSTFINDNRHLFKELKDLEGDMFVSLFSMGLNEVVVSYGDTIDTEIQPHTFITFNKITKAMK